MDRCGYCGGENEAGALLCGGCGSRLDEVGTQKLDNRPQAARTRSLNALSATLILLCDQATMLLLGVGIAVVVYIVGVHQGYSGSDAMRKIHDKLIPFIGMAMPIVGGSAAVLLAFRLVPNQLRDRSPCGAALVPGSRLGLLCAYLAGLAIPSAIYVIARVAHFHASHGHSDFDSIALSSGLAMRIGWAVLVVLVVPSIEEILLRGIVYGGYRKSWGAFVAAAVTTAIFLAFHMPSAFQNLPRTVDLSVSALGALWFRLRFRAIGPAIALHAGHNSMVTALQLIAR